MSTLPASPPLPPLPDAVLLGRLAAIREHLHALEPCCPPGHAAALHDALEAIEDDLLTLGWPCPDEPLTAHDLEVLAALGCPA